MHLLWVSFSATPRSDEAAGAEEQRARDVNLAGVREEFDLAVARVQLEDLPQVDGGLQGKFKEK